MTPELAATLEPLPGKHVRAGALELFVTDHGAGPAIVFLHGLGWTHALWRRQIARYGERYRIIAGDSRGHGQSDKPTGPYTIEDMAADWLAALDALDVPHWCLVGFSQGGRIAQSLALLAPQRTRALVILGSGSKSNPAGRAIMEKRLEAGRASARAGAEAAAASIFSEAFMAREAEFVQAFIAQRAALDFAPLAAATRALFDWDVSGRIPTLRCPATVAVGSVDRLCSVEAARETAGLIPDAEFSVIDGVGHMLTLEAPQAFDPLLDRFLARHPMRHVIHAGVWYLGAKV